MQDTADTIEPAGQADDTQHEAADPAGQDGAAALGEDDEQAQLLLAEAMNSQGGEASEEAPSGTPNGKTDPWDDPASARREIEKLRRESAKWRTQYRQAEPQLAEYQKWLDSQKTEQERLADRLAAAERERDAARLGHARLMAAATYNLPVDLIDFLGDGTDEQIDERAKVLAERLGASAPSTSARAEPARPVQRRPVEALTPGARPADEPPADPNEAFRQFVNSRRG